MIKIDIEKYIKERCWFGWYYSWFNSGWHRWSHPASHWKIVIVGWKFEAK